MPVCSRSCGAVFVHAATEPRELSPPAPALRHHPWAGLLHSSNQVVYGVLDSMLKDIIDQEGWGVQCSLPPSLLPGSCLPFSVC